MLSWVPIQTSSRVSLSDMWEPTGTECVDVVSGYSTHEEAEDSSVIISQCIDGIDIIRT